MVSIPSLRFLDDERENRKMLLKLPDWLVTRWARTVSRWKEHHRNYPPFEEFAGFVEKEAEIACDPITSLESLKNPGTSYISPNSPNSYRKKDAGRPKRNSSSFKTEVKVDEKSCPHCKQKHKLDSCFAFRKFSESDRKAFLMKNGLCFECMSYGHRAYRCKKKQLKNSPTMPARDSPVIPERKTSDDTKTQSKVICSATGTFTSSKIALPILPVRVRAPGSDEQLTVLALLDGGSTNTFIARGLAWKLKLKGEQITLTLTTLDKSSEIETTIVNLEIAAVDSDGFVPLNNVYTRDIIPIKDDNIGRLTDIKRWVHLQDLEISDRDPSSVVLLIGQDHPDLLLPREVRNGGQGAPYATRSLLGWTINGPLGITGSKKLAATANFVAMDALQQQVEKWWKVDDWESIIQERPSMSIEDHQALDVWEKTIVKDNSGHYTLDIPFRKWPPGLCFNRDMADRRLQSLKRRLQRDDELAETYREGMAKLLNDGHAELITDDGPPGATWYLPHHPVFNPKKPGRVRIVFDCSAVKNGMSLNSKVLQGPDLTNSLLGSAATFSTRECVHYGGHRRHVQPGTCHPSTSRCIAFPLVAKWRHDEGSC